MQTYSTQYNNAGTVPTTNVTNVTTTRPVQHTRGTDKCLPLNRKTGPGYGTITFRPLEAKFNHDKDLIGKMDPYCKIKLGFHRGKSTVAKHQGKNPIWNDVITLKSKGQEYAKIKLKDKDRLSLNDRLGKAEIPLSTVYTIGKTSQWYPIKKGDQITGEILVEMQYHPNVVV